MYMKTVLLRVWPSLLFSTAPIYIDIYVPRNLWWSLYSVRTLSGWFLATFVGGRPLWSLWLTLRGRWARLRSTMVSDPPTKKNKPGHILKEPASYIYIILYITTFFFSETRISWFCTVIIMDYIGWISVGPEHVGWLRRWHMVSGIDLGAPGSLYQHRG